MNLPTTADLEVTADAPALAEGAARRFADLARQAAAAQGKFCVALSGGSTPQALYARLAQAPYPNAIPWDKVHLFWGDERCVAPDHADSNFNMARRALLEAIAIPPQNLHRIRGEERPEQAAYRYEIELRSFFSGQSWPRFDLVLLGLGDDGHTASLFPGCAALQERERWAAVVPHTTPPPPLVARVTLTLNALNAAAQAIFLVAGAGKAKILARALENAAGAEKLPAQLIQPTDGRLLWLVDRAARESYEG